MQSFNEFGFEEFSSGGGLVNEQKIAVLQKEKLLHGIESSFEDFVSRGVKNHRVQLLKTDQGLKCIFTVPDQIKEKIASYFEGGTEGVIIYDKSSRELQFPTRCIERSGCILQMASGRDLDNRPVRSMEGVIYVDIPSGVNIRLENLLADELEINRVIGNEELELKDALERDQYLRQNKIELGDKVIGTEEVLDGYKAAIVPGRSQELQAKNGLYAFSHTFVGMEPEVISDALVSIINTGGLLCANERFKRKLFAAGRVGYLPQKDMRSGGADYVFTSIISENNNDSKYTVDLILDPKIADRLDWYSYPNDSYGADPETHIDLTETPAQAVERVSGGNIRGEQFFKLGISIKDVMFVSCGDTERRDILLAKMRNVGISEVNGKKIEDWVLVQSSMAQVFEEIKKNQI